MEGALSALTQPSAWTGTPDDIKLAISRAITLRSLIGQADVRTVPAPYYDDDEDVDDQLPEDEQPWYGYVTDPEAPPGELDFVENALIWGFTGFIALATWEVGFAPAVLFNTLAKKMVLANKRGDVGEVLRIFIDGEEAARIDTTDYAPGEIIETPIIGDPELETHEIMIVQVS